MERTFRIDKVIVGNFALLLMLMFMFLLALGTASARTYYIDPNGSDSNDGSITRPWKNLIYAYNNSRPGDTIYCRGGTYNFSGGGELRGDRGHGKSTGAWTYIKNYPGETPIFNGTNPSYEGNWISVQMSSYTEFDGLTIKFAQLIASGNDVGLGVTDNMVIRNCTFIGPQVRYGYIEFGAMNKSGFVAENNRIIITSAGSGSTTDHGIYVHCSDNTIIRGNTIIGATGFNIHAYDEPHRLPGKKKFRNLLIENNILKNARGRSGILIGKAGDVIHEDTIVRNNICINNGDAGIGSSMDDGAAGMSTGVKIYNNTIYHSVAPREGGFYINHLNGCQNCEFKNNVIVVPAGSYHMSQLNSGRGAGYTIDHNLLWVGPKNLKNIMYDTKSIIGDPKFANAAAEDFHIQSDSAARDAGITLSNVPTDKDGNLRPQGSFYDIGAYENVSGNPLGR